jgi:dipeptidyl aminopeptidase/acylaminoacyl peptidase
MLRRAMVLVGVLLAATSVLVAGDEWTIDDLVTGESVGQWAVDRDGRRAAWVQRSVATMDGDEATVAAIWIADLETGASRQLTRDRGRASTPLFAPDGGHLAFLSDREVPDGDDDLGSRQLWVLPLDGGEPFAVTRWPRSIQQYGWIDATTLVVLAEEAPTWREQRRDAAGDEAEVLDDPELAPPVRLLRVTLDGTTTRLTRNDDWIDSLEVAPSGELAVIRAQQSLSFEFDARVPPKYFVVDLGDGAREQILGDTDLLPSSVHWRPDSSGLYLLDEHSSHPTYRHATIGRLWHHELGSGATEEVDVGWERGFSRHLAVSQDGLVALLADGVHYRPVWIEQSDSGWTRAELTGEHVSNLDSIAVTADGGRVVYEHSTATTPPQGYVAGLDGSRLVAPRQLTDLNPGFADKPTGRVEVVRWTGAEGDEVEGLLRFPLGWSEDDAPAPLVVQIHGGPAGTDRDSWAARWSRPTILWRQRGAFVLQVNYHGSAGYGLEWVESIAERYYELEIPDIERGVDWLIGRGLVDAERLAVTGWSNGGILGADLITRTDRYKAASIGAADVEWFSDWANVDFGASFDNYYFGGPPWEIPEVYLERSPFFRLEEVTTPTIIFTGTADTNVPPHQSRSLFRALQQIGRTEARLVELPGEPHGLRKIAHQRRKLEEETRWLDRFLFASHRPDNPAIREGSALAALLARAKAARVDGELGVELGGTLAPETVPHGGLEVGRFEVTEAQLAAFDPDWKVIPGRHSWPAAGVSFAHGQAYVAWLAESTGRPYRLPTVSEAEKLAASGGNTLDRWAGYTPNPDDAERLRAAIADLGQAPLLQPVGQHAGVGGEPLFDLDGNVAEWAVGEDGEGVPIGPSADRSSDPASSVDPRPAYIGLRVVVDGGE